MATLPAGLALASVWIGIAVSYRIATALPPSSAIVLVAGAFYMLAALAGSRRRRVLRPGGVLRWMR